uniref:Uncharacterized protein n=1 Tax=Populus alba TaxID=43335 RepID=A0A4U5PQQ7_POPAL|nr:hypothetical protein D5086_0000198340 [Populus alba]
MKEKVLGRGVLSQERWNLGLQINVYSSNRYHLPRRNSPLTFTGLHPVLEFAGIVWSTYQLLFRSSIMMIKTVNVQVEDEAVIFPLAANSNPPPTPPLSHLFPAKSAPPYEKEQPASPVPLISHTSTIDHTVRSTTYHCRILTSLPLATALPFSLRHRKQTDTSPTLILLLKSQWPSPLVHEGIGEEGTPDPVGHPTPILIGA